MPPKSRTLRTASKLKTETPDAEHLGSLFAKLKDTKRRLVERGVALGDVQATRDALVLLILWIRETRAQMQKRLESGTLEDASPREVQGVVNFLQILDAELQSDESERPN